MTAQIVRASGASPVHVIDRVAERLAFAASLAFETLDAGSASIDVAATLKRIHGADGIPVVWECSGSTRGLHEAIRTVRTRGAVVAVGFYQGDGDGLKLGDEFHHNGVRVVCGQIGNIHPTHTWASLQSGTLGLAMTGRLILGRLPRLTLPVEDAARGFAALERPGEVLQVALTYA